MVIMVRKAIEDVFGDTLYKLNMLLWWNGLHNALKTHPSHEVVGSSPTSSTSGKILQMLH